MKDNFEHIKYGFYDTENNSFCRYNLFKIKDKKPELFDVFNFDLLHDGDYSKMKKFNSERSKAKGLLSSKFSYKSKKINGFGPLLKSKIEVKDFEKLNYSSLESRIKTILDNWINDGDEFEASDLKYLYSLYLNDFKDYALKNRIYYFLDSKMLNKTKKHELEYLYTYFITIIGIDQSSDTIFIINFGND